jgi:DNA-binding GntR family transcriptional regulator
MLQRYNSAPANARQLIMERPSRAHVPDDANDVYPRIKGLLVDFAFFPGEKIRIPELADRFRVSVTPVREALRRLCAERLLNSTPKRGFHVRKIDANELRDLYSLLNLLLRRSMERHCFEPGVRSLPKLVFSGNSEITIEWLDDLIRELAALGGNREIADIVSNLVDRTHYIQRLALESRAGQDAIGCELISLTSAVTDRDLERAVSALDERLKRELAWLPNLIKEAVNRLYGQLQK